jgi:putative ABC transport system substrate-binding protein
VTVRDCRFAFALMGLLTSPLFAGAEAHGRPTVVVIASVGVEAHRSAIAGIQAALAASPAEVRILDIDQAMSTAGGGLAAPGPGVIIAVGSEAIRVVEAERPKVPAVYTMILHRRAEWDAQGRQAPVTIPLEVSLASLLAWLKELFPGKTRLGIIVNASGGDASDAQIQAHAQQLGFTVRIAECAGAAQLLAALASLRNQADFVWCLPDGTLYNSATVKPLILASLENRLPLIGFSESFTKAGAAIGIYPDFQDVGAQAGEAARQLLERQIVRPAEGPRRLKVAVNPSVLRLFGLRYAAAATGEITVLP